MSCRFKQVISGWGGGVLLFILIATFSFQVMACNGDKKSDTDISSYEERIRHFRMSKDSFMVTPHSPLKPEARSTFTGLSYYPPDPTFSVPAKLVRRDSSELEKIPTSDGEVREMEHIGQVHFRLGNEDFSLEVYLSEADHPSLFIPFRDQTNGSGTYETGRYLDVDYLPGEDSLTLDFNMAYNPYCAYNEEYSCPLVPSSNTLTTRIVAGERSSTYH